MGTPGKQWRHVTIGTLNSWLPGDPRGFRSRHHRVHSGGDHRAPPPPTEHLGLRRHAQAISGRPVVVPRPLRPVIGRTVREHLQQLGHHTLVICVSAMHVHAQVELPRDCAHSRLEVGRCKRLASLAARKQLPGRVWARKCGLKPIKDRAHQVNVYNYIRDHHTKGAWVWTLTEGELPFKG